MDYVILYGGVNVFGAVLIPIQKGEAEVYNATHDQSCYLYPIKKPALTWRKVLTPIQRHICIASSALYSAHMNEKIDHIITYS